MKQIFGRTWERETGYAVDISLHASRIVFTNLKIISLPVVVRVLFQKLSAKATQRLWLKC